jgi:hypothetical protein
VANLRALVAEYKVDVRRDAAAELDDFRRANRTDEDAISQAALAELPTGKRHSHQYRIQRAALRESRRRLLEQLPQLRLALSFDELLGQVDRIVRPIRGIGELTTYDTALKIGARFGLEPEVVYLHRGTREGARNLWLRTRGGTLRMSDLPRELRTLKPREVEDFLCLYKDEFGDTEHRRRRYAPRARPKCGDRGTRKRTATCAAVANR